MRDSGGVACMLSIIDVPQTTLAAPRRAVDNDDRAGGVWSTMVCMTTVEVARPRALWTDVRFLLGIVLIVASVAGVGSSLPQPARPHRCSRLLIRSCREKPSPPTTSKWSRSRSVRSAMPTLRPVDSSPVWWRCARSARANSFLSAPWVTPRVWQRPRSCCAAPPMFRRRSPKALSSKCGRRLRSSTACSTSRASWSPKRRWCLVTRDDSMIGGGAAALELVIDRADVASTLSAIADGSALSVVPTGGAAR